MSGFNTHLPDDTVPSTAQLLDGNVLVGLNLLRQAYTYAQDTGVDLWDFALEIDKLYDAGLTNSDLRWLVARGIATRGLETTAYGDNHRSFRPAAGFRFENTSCLVITPLGAAFAASVLQDASLSPQPPSIVENASIAGETAALLSDRPFAGETGEGLLKPRWDPTRRELCVAEAIVKRFRVPAPNQETILGVFEEEGWPEQIDDPLPIREDIDPRTRLHDTINRLNGCQAHALLRFHGNGSGTGVSWELLQLDLLRRTDHSAAARA